MGMQFVHLGLWNREKWWGLHGYTNQFLCFFSVIWNSGAWDNQNWEGLDTVLWKFLNLFKTTPLPSWGHTASEWHPNSSSELPDCEFCSSFATSDWSLRRSHTVLRGHTAVPGQQQLKRGRRMVGFLFSNMADVCFRLQKFEIELQKDWLKSGI